MSCSEYSITLADILGAEGVFSHSEHSGRDDRAGVFFCEFGVSSGYSDIELEAGIVNLLHDVPDKVCAKFCGDYESDDDVFGIGTFAGEIVSVDVDEEPSCVLDSTGNRVGSSDKDSGGYADESGIFTEASADEEIGIDSS